MELLRLELKGFKSFADKTIVHFSPGLTAIVGPNGSGKSNISDAIRWVLGESNIRQLRGHKAEDIIFSGTEKRRPMGSAEVTLVFDNTDNQLEEALPEVALKRRLYRNGDSEFFINNRTCRLKDIHRLLANTGLGRDSMAIIGQNRVDAILNSKAEERRLIFEDVAGISLFKMNKEEALRRMAVTERNMERVRDIMATLESQLETLRERADQARKHDRLAKEKRQYDGALLYHSYKTAERLLTRLENEHGALQEEQGLLEESRKEKEEERGALVALREATDIKVRALEEQYSEARREEERIRGDLQLLESEIKSLEQSQTDGESRLADMKVAFDTDTQRARHLIESIENEKEEWKRGKENSTVIEATYNEALGAYEQGKAQWVEQQNKEQADREQREVEVRSWERAKAEIALVETQLEEQERLVSTLMKEVSDTFVDLERSQKEIEHQKNELGELSKKRHELQISYDIVRKKGREEQERVRELQTQRQQVEGRVQLLATWIANHEGYAASTKALLNAKASWRSSIHGAVGELFDVQEQYTQAIEVALGGNIHALVTAQAKSAGEAIDYLKKTQQGRATFLPLDTVVGRLPALEALAEDGIMGRGTDCITFEPIYRNIFAYLLGRTLVAQDLSSALRVQKKYKGTLRIVTLHGELLQPGGSVTGGSIHKKRSNVISRQGELQTLERELATLLQSIEEALQVEKKAGEEEKNVLEEMDVTNQSIRTRESSVAVAEGQESMHRERWTRKKTTCGEIETKMSTLRERQAELHALIASWESRANNDGTLANPTDGEQNITLDTLHVLEIEQQKAYESVMKIRFNLARWETSWQEKERQLESVQQQIKNYEARRTPLTESLLRITEELEYEYPKKRTDLLVRQERNNQECERLHTERQNLYELAKTYREKEKELDKEREEWRGRDQMIQKRLIDVERRLTKVRLDSEVALQGLFSLGFSRDEGQRIAVEGRVSDWQTKQDALKEELEALGPINPNAVAELEEGEERHAFLGTQLGDLEDAKKQLETVIKEIDMAMSRQFSEVFETISEKFQTIFAQLFGGGKAQLVLTDKDDILSGGIEMYIQPPGKKRQPLPLLSGGERALTVIALLFAFLDFRPAPFCVLDEVDAALDEANVERFSRFINTLSAKTQFVVVTHRKKTMESARVLQGVTMLDQGVSQLLMVSFDDIEEDL